jgi:shikimate dehydrogenase
MLLHQAAPAFERWFGVRPEVTPELRALVAADLALEARR